MTALRGLVRTVQGLVPAGGGGLCVLCYHLVEGGSSLPIDLSERRFRDQLMAVGGRFHLLRLDEALSRLERGELDDTICVAVTFDDAYANFRERVWPVLAELGVPATLFVPVGFIEDQSQPPIAGFAGPPLRWDDFHPMIASGLLSIGSHSWTHPDLRTVPESGLERELHASRQMLERRLNVKVDTFCYPRALWSPRVEREVARFYSRAVVGGGARTVRSAFRPLRVERVSVRADHAAKTLVGQVERRVALEEWAANKVRLWR